MLPKGFDWVNKTIVDRLVTRFTLGEVPAVQRPYILRREVILTTDLDKLLGHAKIETGDFDLSAGPGAWTAIHEVPLGKRWTVLGIYQENTIDPSQLALYLAGRRFIISANVNTVKIIPNLNYQLEQTDGLWALSTANVGDDTIEMSILVIVEDAY